MPDFDHSRQTAHKMITRWGKPGWLIRNGVKRPCYIARQEYKPRERELYLVGSSRFFMSTKGITIEPDTELDIIEWPRGKRQYRMNPPIVGPRPDDSAIFYDINVTEVKAE